MIPDAMGRLGNPEKGVFAHGFAPVQRAVDTLTPASWATSRMTQFRQCHVTGQMSIMTRPFSTLTG